MEEFISFTSNGANTSYHDLTENFVTFIVITFLNEKNEIIDFCPRREDDLLFCLGLEFKRQRLL